MDMRELCKKIELQQEIRRPVLEFCEGFDFESVRELLEGLQHMEMEKEARERLKAELGPDPGQVKMLACFLWAAKERYLWYRELGIPESVFVDTMKSFPRFIGECKEITGEYAFDREWWTARQIGGRLFRLGELEYEMTRWNGQPVLSVHIPSDADFTEKKCDGSIRMAREFFHLHKKHFPEYADAEYICHSWLLAPELRELLEPNSNILNFQSRFRIQAVDYEGNDYIEWVFKRRAGEISFENLPESTTLQKRMKDHLMDGGKIGAGFGRMFFMTAPRIGFSTWQQTDGPLAQQLWGDGLVTRYISASGVFTKKDICSRLAQEMERQERYGVQYWPLFERQSQEFLGCCGLRPYDLDQGIYELGVHLKADAWGKGYAFEAARQAMDYGLHERNARKLFAGHNPGNKASAALLKKLRFQYSHEEYYEPTGLMHPSYFYEETIPLRKYRSEDCEELARLFYDTVHTVNARDYREDQLNVWATGQVDLERWNQSFLSHETIVATENGIIIGFGDMDETGYLDRLYVHKDHQGKGVAFSICRELEKIVSAPRYTTHASITARPFFEKRGYRVVKEQQVERQGVYLTNYVMEKIR